MYYIQIICYCRLQLMMTDRDYIAVECVCSNSVAVVPNNWLTSPDTCVGQIGSQVQKWQTL